MLPSAVSPQRMQEILAERRQRLETLSTSMDDLAAGREVAAKAIRPLDADGTGEEILDPAFQAQLRQLEGGFDPVAAHAKAPAKQPTSLTNIEIDAADFPSLLPSEADRQLLEHMGLEMKVPDTDFAPLADEASSPQADPPLDLGSEPFDAEARDDLTDQIASVFSLETGAASSVTSTAPPAAEREAEVASASAQAPAAQTAAQTAAAQPVAEDAEIEAAWTPSAETVVWEWPHLEDRIVREEA